MLGKLLKHEYKVTARYFVPMYVVVGIMTLLLKLSFLFSGDSAYTTMESNPFLDIVQGLLIAVYVLVVLGTCILSVFFLVKRFYTNMYGDDGYLMHTLPVTGTQLLNSKLICSFTWILSLIPVGLLSFLILFAGTDTFSAISYFWGTLTEQFYTLNISGLSIGITIAESIFYFLLSILAGLLSYYLAIALGQHFLGEHRLMGAILFYFLLSIVASAISSVLNTITEGSLSLLSVSLSSFMLQAMNLALAMNIVTNLILIVAYYLVLRYLLNQKLNLY